MNGRKIQQICLQNWTRKRRKIQLAIKQLHHKLWIPLYEDLTKRGHNWHTYQCMLGFRTMTTPNFKIAVFWLRIMVNSTPHEATIYLERHYLWKHMKMHICMQLWSGFICLNGVPIKMALKKIILPLCW